MRQLKYQLPHSLAFLRSGELETFMYEINLTNEYPLLHPILGGPGGGVASLTSQYILVSWELCGISMTGGERDVLFEDVLLWGFKFSRPNLPGRFGSK